MAVLLKRHKSMISREVRRNHGLRGYRPKQAQRLARPAARPEPSRGLHPGLGRRLRTCCARTGVWSRSAAGCRRSRACRSAMNGSTSMSMRTSAVVASSIFTCVAGSCAGNATGVMTAGGKSGAGSRSTSGRGSLRNASASATGRPTP
ncbi:MAG: hypothetical protein CL929_03810 [Deltaproteobacteria bacterium]|nr:hypothetical protein [Deltaproteobacteria bacterium]